MCSSGKYSDVGKLCLTVMIVIGGVLSNSMPVLRLLLAHIFRNVVMKLGTPFSRNDLSYSATSSASYTYHCVDHSLDRGGSINV